METDFDHRLGKPTDITFLTPHPPLGSIYTKRQHKRCDNSAMTLVIIENNKVTSEWGSNPFLSDTIDFTKNSIISVIA